MKAGKSLSRVVCVFVHHQQHRGRTPLAILLLWRVSVSTAYLPPTGGQTVVSPPVASIAMNFDTTSEIASALASLL
jgi:hypothetical protein